MNFEEYSGLAQALFEESDAPLFLTDGAVEFVIDANGTAQRLCGASLRELIGATVSQLFQSKKKPGLRPTPSIARRIEWPYAKRQCELRVSYPPGWRPVDLLLTRLLVRPRPLALLSVTEPQKSGTTHRILKNRRLRELVAGVCDCLWSAEVFHQRDVVFRCVTPAIERLTGRPSWYLGQDLENWRAIIHPQDAELWEQIWERRRAGLADSDEYRITDRDGSIHWVRERVVVRRANQGDSIWLFGVVSELAPHESKSLSIAADTARFGPQPCGPG